jgi:uncharacterized membrane protein
MTIGDQSPSPGTLIAAVAAAAVVIGGVAAAVGLAVVLPFIQ